MATYFEYCALHYLNQWLSEEQPLHRALKEGSWEEKLEALRKASTFFRVARTLPKKFELKSGRLEPVLTVLEKPEYSVVREEKLTQIVSAVLDEISRQYGNRTVLSATTKFLWLKHRDPVIIYDSYVQAALKEKGKGYESFVAEWRLQYRKRQSEIEEACLRLPGMDRYNICGDSISEQNISEWSTQTWFHQRVFDIFLWHSEREEA